MTFHYKEQLVEDFREVIGICCENDKKCIHCAVRCSVLRMQQAIHNYELAEKTYITVF